MVTHAALAENPLSRRLRELADTDPNGVILDEPGAPVTWAELDAEADAVAALLSDRLGIGAQCVAVRIRSYRAMLATPIGVARAGKVLVPLDPSMPPERAAQVLSESDAALLLTDLEALPVPSVSAEAWVGQRERLGTWTGMTPGAPSAVIFTSGSTGVPKGIAETVEQTERAATLLGDIVEPQRLAAFDVGSVANFGSIIGAAVRTGSVLVPYDVYVLGLAHFHEWIRDRGITAVGAVPTLLKFWLPSLPEGWVLEPLQVVISFGEQLMWNEASVLRGHLPDSARLLNTYGLSETGGISRFEVLPGDNPAEGKVPAGTVMGDVRVLITGADGEILPVGSPGEIVVEGTGIALGYWRRPELDEGVFLELPGGERAIRTGDRGSLDAEGNLHHLGRLDDIVKVAGHRIELGDVDAALRSLPDVADAVTVASDAELGDVRLRSHVVLVPGSAQTGLTLRQALTRLLPGFMLPDGIDVRTELPHLASGKVDRTSLQAMAPVIDPSASTVDADVVHRLQSLFARVLELPSVGPDDDFFALGGDSLRGARLFAEIERTLGLDRPPTLLLEAPTPARLAVELTAPRSVLVPGRVTGSLAPLFVLHGGRGDLLWLRDLVAALDPEQPVYGLLAPALDGFPPAETSLEELAAHYLAEVRQVWRRGPLHLYGYSLGGRIGFEMARQVRAEGGDLGLVAIGDVPADPEDKARLTRAQLLARQVEVLRSAAPREAVRHIGRLLANQAQFWAGRIPEERRRRRLEQQLAATGPGEAVPVELRGDFVFRTYGWLSYCYRPGPLDHPVLLLRTGGPRSHRPWGWERYADPVEVVDVPGEHSRLMRDHSPAVAAVLTEALTAHRRSSA
jgi:acyl-coenzyme A synthetase/AMP-(fatty) acid ligase/thioesterase domain-containing protein